MHQNKSDYARSSTLNLELNPLRNEDVDLFPDNFDPFSNKSTNRTLKPAFLVDATTTISGQIDFNFK